jgi:RND family efflux transporter MFP subunit
LEPLEGESGKVFNKAPASDATAQPNVTPPASKQPRVGTGQPSFSQTPPPRSSTAEVEAKASIESSASQQGQAPTQRSNHTQDTETRHESNRTKPDTSQEPPRPSFQPDVEAASNILQEMERYPLVEADYSSSYQPSRVMSAVGSILELYGPKKILFTVLLVIAGFFLYDQWQQYFDDGLAVKVATVEQGEIYQAITVPGKVVSKLRVNLTPSIAGRLTHIFVEEGDTVKSGDLLARLDDREAKSYLKRAKASFEGAKEDVVLAERSLKRLKQAFEKGAVAKKLVEEAEIELRSAKAREKIAEEEVRSAKLALENPRIVAPFSGTITARYVEVGQWVVPSETLFTLIDEKQREVEVQVDAADSGGIAVGQTVTLSSDAFPGLEWNESVTRLAAATNNVGNANTVSVYISLGNNAPSLRFGQQVDADIRTAWNPNALKVPFGALISKGGKTYVATIKDGKVNLVEVVTGIEDFSHVEVLQGVNVGQSVVLANGRSLQEGQKVYIASSS